MSFSPVMEWSAKWDWENLVMFGSRVCESPKKFQPTDWGIEEEGEIDTGSFNLSGGSGCGIGGCGSDVGHGSSAKSTISASTDSSSKEGMRTSNYGFEGLSVEFSKREYAMKLSGLSPPLETSVGSGEPLIGLELGSHFENSSAGANSKTSSFIVIPASSATAAKKIKPSCQSLPTPRCIVEGCNLDLSGAKEYHKKHRICESHSKSPKVVIAGHERRFCQQCSRFHGLSEFDEKKRSCRRRLADHNARRRKPPQETMHISPTRLASSFYDGEQRISFVWSNPPLIQAKPGINSMWESASNSKFTLTNGYELKHEKAKSCNGLRHVPDIQLPHTIRMPDNHSGRLLPSKGTSFESLNQGSKETMLSFKTDAAPDLPRALSLLSTSSWGSHEQRSSELDRPFPINQSSITQHAMRGVSQALPLSSSGFWHSKQQSADGNNSSHFQELQLFNAPFESSFYSHPLN